MKTTLTIAAIAMFAVMLGISAFSPAMAAKEAKIFVCHFEEEELDADGNIIEDAQWKVININGNAKKAHVDKHTDGINYDVELSQEDVDAGLCSDGTHPDSIPEDPEIPADAEA